MVDSVVDCEVDPVVDLVVGSVVESVMGSLVDPVVGSVVESVVDPVVKKGSNQTSGDLQQLSYRVFPTWACQEHHQLLQICFVFYSLAA